MNTPVSAGTDAFDLDTEKQTPTKKPLQERLFCKEYGGNTGIRTWDPIIMSDVL